MKQSLYLETSIIGAYLDNGEPFRRDLTIRWWEHEMPDYRAVVSPLVAAELSRLKEPHRTSYLKLLNGLEQVDLTEEAADSCGRLYLARNFSSEVHRRCSARCYRFVSQDRLSRDLEFRTPGQRSRRQARIRLFNTAAGFFVPMIVTPEFLVSEATEKVK